MYTIYLYHSYNFLFKYESEILPQLGDMFTLDEFEDKQARVVKQRILHPSSDNKGLITITVDYAYPKLVPQPIEKQEPELSETNY